MKRITNREKCLENLFDKTTITKLTILARSLPGIEHELRDNFM